MDFVLADVVAVAGMAISVLVFVLMATSQNRKSVTIETVLLADRSANSSQFGASFAAASSSLATVLIFFISTSVSYGFVLFWCGLTYLFGQFAFIIYLKNIAKIETTDLTTNADFFLEKSESIISARAISVLTFFTFLAILFLELYIGSEILRYYIHLSGNVSQILAFTLLGTVIMLYVRLGGLRVVFRTDVWQLMLMSIACLALLVYAFAQPIVGAAETPVRELWAFSASGQEVFWFMAWIMIVNLTLPFTQLSSWQRYAATKNAGEALKGLLSNIPQFSIIWFVPVFALIVLNSKGIAPENLTDLFDAVRAVDPTISLALFPLIFVGFASALFSTADTALVALQFSISDKATFGNAIRKQDQNGVARFYLIFTMIVIVALAVLYSLAEGFTAWFMPLIFVIFGQLTVIAPQLVYAIGVHSGRWRQRGFSALSSWINVVGISIAWSISIAAGVAEAAWPSDYPALQEGSTYLALFISAVFLSIAVHFANDRHPPPSEDQAA